MKEKVSIIMPTYNSAKFIAESIASVIAQTYTNWELLITDDCSTDKSYNIINEYATKDTRIHIYKTPQNSGAAIARNVALSYATGRYIAFLDSDDLWVPDKLEKQIAFMKDHNIAFSFSNYDIIKEDGTKTGKVIHSPKTIGYNAYLRNTIIGCLTVVIDRSKTGDFTMPNIKSSHDMALWLLIMKRGFYAYAIQETLAHYRLVSTSNTAKKWKAAKDVWRVYREIEHINLFYSAFCFAGYSINALLKRL